MNDKIQEAKWSKNVILVDADYVDRVAFNLIVNFERMLGRRIPQADMAKWIDCVALDGGMRPGSPLSPESPLSPSGSSPKGEEQETMVVMIHRKDRKGMENFVPSDYAGELDGKAFKDNLGEFTIGAYPIEDIANGADFFTEALELILAQKEVERVIVIPNAEDEHIYNKVRATLNRADADKKLTLLAMQPMPGGNFRQEILGYSLMAALGIKGDEVRGEW